MAEKNKQRLSYIDWMRGLACVFMFQTHGYDSWLSDDARHSTWFKWSQLGGTLPAPLFLFLAGISFALVTGRLRSKGIAAGEIARTTIRRGAEIFGLGLLLRVHALLLGWRCVPSTDLLRVDVLNIIGLSMVLMGAVCYASVPHVTSAAEATQGISRERAFSIVVSLLVALTIAFATPPLWTTHRPRWLPWYLESYVNGVHNLSVTQPWLFPAFPWVAFAFEAMTIGIHVFSLRIYAQESIAMCLSGLAGVSCIFIGQTQL